MMITPDKSKKRAQEADLGSTQKAKKHRISRELLEINIDEDIPSFIDDAARQRYQDHFRDADEERRLRIDLESMRNMTQRFHRLWMEQYISETYDVMFESS